MNAEPMVDDRIRAVALDIACFIYGGLSEESYQWDRCVEAATAICGHVQVLPQQNRWMEAKAAFEAAQAFNQRCPNGSEGMLKPDYGPQVQTRVGHMAMVFPQPRVGQKVMAWFEQVGWASVTQFEPYQRKASLAEELNGVALAAKQQGRMELAKAVLYKAIEADPKYWHAMNELGIVLFKENSLEEAAIWYDRALAIAPNSGEALNNRAAVYRALGRTEEAVRDMRAAMALLPKNDILPLNVAATIDDTGDFDGSLKVIDDQLAKNPSNLNALYNKSLLHLSHGKLTEGWKLYDYRLARPMVNARYEHYGIPRVQERPVGKNVLVWGEQGLGDEIFLASMLPDLIADTQSVLFLCTDRLNALMRRSFPNIAVDTRNTSQLADMFRPSVLPAQLMPKLVKLLGPNCQMSAADLGRIYRPTMYSFPRKAFLKADEVRRDKFRRMLAPNGEKLVGISWHSDKNPEIGSLKRIGIDKWGPILNTPGVKFVNLQYGDVYPDITKAKELFGVDIEHVSDLNILKDLDGFAALVAAMDLVVSSANTAVHVAGGLDVPCWVMTPSGPGKLWYYFTEIDFLPWYNSVKLFRQGAASQWTDVIDRIADELARWQTGGSAALCDDAPKAAAPVLGTVGATGGPAFSSPEP